jgi:hypothetical protein
MVVRGGNISVWILKPLLHRMAEVHCAALWNLFGTSASFTTKIVRQEVANTQTEFYVLLTVHLGIIFLNNLEAHFFFMYVYFSSLHVSGSHVPIIRRINCINTASGICHSV